MSAWRNPCKGHQLLKLIVAHGFLFGLFTFLLVDFIGIDYCDTQEPKKYRPPQLLLTYPSVELVDLTKLVGTINRIHFIVVEIIDIQSE